MMYLMFRRKDLPRVGSRLASVMTDRSRYVCCSAVFSRKTVLGAIQAAMSFIQGRRCTRIATALAVFATLSLSSILAPSAHAQCLPSSSSDPSTMKMRVPGWTVRKNRRYIAPDGNDQANGLSHESPWATLQANIKRVPKDTEIIFVDGDYHFDRSVYWSTTLAGALPPKVTIRAERFRGAVLRGSDNPIKRDDGLAFGLLGRVRDLEIWGLAFENWDGGGAGTILAEQDVIDLRIIGNRFRDNGSSKFHHVIYLAGGASRQMAPRGWAIEHNEAILAPGSGSFIAVRNGPHGAHNGSVRNNTVHGDGLWAMIVNDVRVQGTRSVIVVADNNFDGYFREGVIQFGNYTTPAPLNGVDSSFVVENNVLRNRSPARNAYAIWRWPEIGFGLREHAPTLRGNTLEVSGERAVSHGLL